MRRDRAIWVVLALLGITTLAYVLYQRGPSGLGWYPGCLFRRVTGLHCPGCGMTRATYSAMHGDLLSAFRYNPLGMVLFPVAVMGASLELTGWVRGRPLPWRLSVAPRRGVWLIVGIIVSYGLLRNLPWWPFTLLAPP